MSDSLHKRDVDRGRFLCEGEQSRPGTSIRIYENETISHIAGSELCFRDWDSYIVKGPPMTQDGCDGVYLESPANLLPLTLTGFLYTLFVISEAIGVNQVFLQFRNSTSAHKGRFREEKKYLATS